MRTPHEIIKAAKNCWRYLPPHVKARDTSKHLIAVIELAESLLGAEKPKPFGDSPKQDA